MLPDTVEDMTFKDRVEWTTQMAFDGLIRGGTKEMKNAIFSALHMLALVDSEAGSRWAVKESTAIRS